MNLTKDEIVSIIIIIICVPISIAIPFIFGWTSWYTVPVNLIVTITIARLIHKKYKIFSN